MNTREIASEYRLAHWAGIMRNRGKTGQSIRSYCKTEGIHENTYYYWQKKLREAAYLEMQPPKPEANATITGIPPGWAVCTLTKPETDEKSVQIEIGKCRIRATSKTDEETLTKVCRILASIC